MSALRNLTGMVFGRLTALRRAGRTKSGNVVWECACRCGTQTQVQSSNLVMGHTHSCACISRELAGSRLKGHHGKDRPGFKHGYSLKRHVSKTYRARQLAMDRCTNPNNPRWSHYGGAGVKVDPRWMGKHGFESFLALLGECPSSKHSLSRFLDTGNYEPGNVEWATDAEQKAEARGKRAMLALHRYHESLSIAADEVD